MNNTFSRKLGAEELKFIVSELNVMFDGKQEPLTLWSFDEKSNFELLELLNSVIGNIDAQNKIDLRDETQDKTISRLCDFLRIMQYPSNYDLEFQKGLITGDSRIIHPIL